MNVKILVGSLAVFLCLALCSNRSLAQKEEELLSKISSATDAGRTQEIASLLEQGEALWTNSPITYLEFECRSMGVLGRAGLSNRTLLTQIFDNVMQKSAPGDITLMRDYFREKSFLAVRYLSLIRSPNRDELLELAQFLGEIRINRIRGYIVSVPLNSTESSELDWAGFLPAIPLQLPPIQTNSEEQLAKATNEIQSVLADDDRLLTVHLLSRCGHFSSSKQTDSGFIKQVIAAAHLTEEESRKLKGKNNSLSTNRE